MTGIIWNVIFILINLLQLVRLLRERRRLHLPLDDKALLRELLTGLDDFQIAKLLRSAQWRTLDPGALLTCEAKPVEELYLLSSGRAVVKVRGNPVARLERGSFIGEVAFLTGQQASATVVVSERARVLAFPRSELEQAFEADHAIASVMHRVLGHDLAVKMRFANDARA
jgi:CRP-like cAMP-binding protein